MSRTRILSAAAAVLTLALTVVALAAPSNARAEYESTLAPRPQVGQCRTTTFDQGGYFTDNRRPVRCSTLHRMRTFAVVDVPRSFNYLNWTSAQIVNLAMSLCSAKFEKAVGGGHARREQTAYTFFFFGPSYADRQRGARWMRCDLVLLANSTLAALPNLTFPVLEGRSITERNRRCLVNTNNDYWTICSRQHVARANQIFRFPSTAAYPSPSVLKAATDARCPGKRSTRPSRYSWRHGNRVITCYAVTTS